MSRATAILLVLSGMILRAQEPASPPKPGDPKEPDDLIEMPLAARPPVPSARAEADALLVRIQAGIERVKKERDAAAEEARPAFAALLQSLEEQVASVKGLRDVLQSLADLAATRGALEQELDPVLPERLRQVEAEVAREKELTRPEVQKPEASGLAQPELARKLEELRKSRETVRLALSSAQDRLRDLQDQDVSLSRALEERPAALVAAEKDAEEAAVRSDALREGVRAAENGGGPAAQLWALREAGYAAVLRAGAWGRQVEWMRVQGDTLMPLQQRRCQAQLAVARLERDLGTLRVERLDSEEQALRDEQMHLLTQGEEETAKELELARPHEKPLLELKKQKHATARRNAEDQQQVDRWDEWFSPTGEFATIALESESLAADIQRAKAGPDDDALPRTTRELARLVEEVESRHAAVVSAATQLDELRARIRDELAETKGAAEAVEQSVARAYDQAWEKAHEEGYWRGFFLDTSQWDQIREELKAVLEERRKLLVSWRALLGRDREKLQKIEVTARANRRVLTARFLWMRESSAISLAAFRRAVEDVQQLPATVWAQAKDRVVKWSAWVIDPANRVRASIMGALVLVLVLAGIVIHRRMPGTFSWLENRQSGRGGRFFRVLATVIRRTEVTLILALGLIAFCIVTRTHPRDTEALGLLLLTPFLYRLGKVLNDILFSPENRDERLLRVGDGVAGALHATLRWLLILSLAFVPAGLLLDWSGYGAADRNPGFLELWWFVYQLLFYVVLLVGAFRPRVILSFVHGQGALAATVKTFLLISYPVVAGAVILLLVLQSLRYDVAVRYLREVFLQLAGVLIVAYAVYRALLRKFLPGRNFRARIEREDFDNDEHYVAAGRRHAYDRLGRLGLRALVFGPALIVMTGIWRELTTRALPEGFLDGGEVRFALDVVASVLVAWIAATMIQHYRRVMRFAVMPVAKLDHGLQYAILTLSTYVLIGIALVVSLRTLRIDADQIGWFLAPLAVGIGFGLQDIVKSFVAGIVLLLERPIRVGDQVNVGGQTGVVEKINLRSTTLLTFENVGIIVPNEQLVSGVLNNRAAGSAFIRTAFPVSVSYDADVKLAMRIMMEAMEGHGLVRKKPVPEVFFVGFGDSALDFECRFWAKVSDHRLRMTSDLRNSILSQFKKQGIEMPFPQRDLHLRSVSKEVLDRIGGAGAEVLPLEPNGDAQPARAFAPAAEPGEGGPG